MKKIVSLLAITVLTSSLSLNTVSAKEAATSMSENEVKQLLMKKGYDSDSIKEMESEDKKILAKAIKENPGSVDVNFSVTEIDNLSLLEYFTNTKDSQLVKDGYNKAKIKKIRENLKTINSLTLKQMQSKYKISASECKMIKKALKKNPKYKSKKIGAKKEVTASGSIATSKMTYSMSKVNKSTKKAPNYRMTITYNWKTPYFVDIFSDNIAVSWGGGFNTKNISSKAKYYLGNWYTTKYGKKQYTTSWSKEEKPNKGLIFTTKQARKNASQQNKTGTIKFTLYQTKFKGYHTKVISQFAHKKVTAQGISISGSPSISIGTEYDTSAQKAITLKY